MEDGDDTPNAAQIDQKKMLSFGSKVKAELHNLWGDSASDVFDIG